jgi:tetratricopeptide (TPR) repeat protein
MTTIREALLLASDHECHGRLADAEGVYRLILAIQPQNPIALNNLGLLAPPPEAANFFRRAIAALPATGDSAALAATHVRAGQHAAAAECYRQTLAAAPDPAFTALDTANILEAEGRLAEAKPYRDQVPRPLQLLIQTAPTPRRTVLIAGAVGKGNIPLDALLPAPTTTRILWFTEFATDEQAAALPPYDVAINAIGDADVIDPSFDRLTALHAQRPLLNPPEAVRRTRRDRIPALLAGIPDIVVPAIYRLPPDQSQMPLTPPFLVRPIVAHGGEDMIRVDTASQAASLKRSRADAQYATAFHDFRSPDGYYRKYRIIYVDRVPYAYHLAISRHWLVHYFSADMLTEPWKRDEERAYLENPAQTLGPKAMAAITAFGQRLNLDYAGIDFSILPDGSVLVFEANATMLVHLRDSAEDFPYKHAAVPKIFAAFDAMLDRYRDCRNSAEGLDPAIHAAPHQELCRIDAQLQHGEARVEPSLNLPPVNPSP